MWEFTLLIKSRHDLFQFFCFQFHIVLYDVTTSFHLEKEGESWWCYIISLWNVIRNLLNFLWHGCFLDTAAIVTSLYFCKCAFSFVCVMWRRHLRLRLHMGGNKIIVCCVPNLVERKREPFKIDPKGFCTTPAAAAFYLERYISVYFSEEKFPMPSCYLANFHRIPFDAICTIFLSGLLHQRIYSSSSQNLK